MKNVISEMVDSYHPITLADKENALKEVLQEVVLSGLSRGGFFDKAAFYGGTCLRIFYGLDRFSEDLDFALTKENPSFSLESYFSSLKKEMASYGLAMEVEEKKKVTESNIQSAFVKGNTRIEMLKFFPNSPEVRAIVSNQTIKVKFEVDVHPALGGSYEEKYRLIPSPYSLKTFDAPSLFAGKIHAVLCRRWKSRVKGRDLFDYVFYLLKNTPVNLVYLENKLKQSRELDENARLTLEDLKALLNQRFAAIDFEAAKKDVTDFLSDISSLKLWKEEFFSSITENLTAQMH